MPCCFPYSSRYAPFIELCNRSPLPSHTVTAAFSGDDLPHITKHFIGDRLSKYEQDPDKIPNGSGKLIKADGQLYAVYKDDNGQLHAMSPECRHLGCIVQFNTAEKTWDCPCHGGRYNAYGKPIMGPPRAALAEESVEKLLQPEKV